MRVLERHEVPNVSGGDDAGDLSSGVYNYLCNDGTGRNASESAQIASLISGAIAGAFATRGSIPGTVVGGIAGWLGGVVIGATIQDFCAANGPSSAVGAVDEYLRSNHYEQDLPY